MCADPAGGHARPASASALSWSLQATLNIFNLHSLVQGTTSTEGMKRLIDQVAGVGNGLAVGGEGLNEITAQGQSFGQ